MMGNKAREREREIWGERDRNMVERENGMGLLRRWHGLI